MLKYIYNKIIIDRSYFILFELILDRILFKLFYEKIYKKKFFYYGDNIFWGRDGIWRLIPKNVRVSNIDKISIGSNTTIDEYVYLQAHHESEGLVIDNNVRINAHTHIQAYSKIHLESYVLVAPYAHINSGNHEFEQEDIPIMNQGYIKSGPIIIGKGVWLGRGATVLGNVVIGENSVVATQAVVTKSFPNKSILAGVPAKLIKTI